MATLQQSNDRATVSEKNPSFDELSPSQGHVITTSDIEALPIGKFAAIFTRETVRSEWEPCVLLRKASNLCVVFDKTGAIQKFELPCGFNEDGSPIDDGVSSEWDMTVS
eukprot:4971-Pleurochrysis_carterae.AAC.1